MITIEYWIPWWWSRHAVMVDIIGGGGKHHWQHGGQGARSGTRRNWLSYELTGALPHLEDATVGT
jgi:hypothetical protein